jgi:opacity protein-like surface antigen
LIIPTLGLFSLTATAQAATFEAELQSGRRWAESRSQGKTNGVQMDEVTAAAHYSPLSGLSVGPSLTYQRFHTGDLAEGMTGSNYELGLEAKYGYSITERIMPYARARWIGYSKGSFDIDTSDSAATINFRTSGAQLGIGAAFGLTSNVMLTAEAGYGVQMLKATGGEVERVNDSQGNQIALTEDQKGLEGSDAEAFNSKSFVVGLNVNI